MSISIEEYKKKYKEQSAEIKLSVVSSVCSLCSHFDISDPIARQCSAFPEGIPLPIWKGDNNHTESYPGDNGIHFTKLSNRRAA